MITTVFELLLYWQMTYISSSIILRLEYHTKEIIETKNTRKYQGEYTLIQMTKWNRSLTHGDKLHETSY